MNDQEKKILIQHRLGQAQAALDEAKLLADQSRVTLGAINRAYYAMFYSVLALLQHIGKVPRKHSGAISLFDTEFVKKEIFPKELSNHLHQAFESRQVSDYHAVEMLDREDTDELIRNASDFVQKIKTYLEERTGDEGT